jgi:lysyl-tRNA synthetase class 1
MSDALRVPTSIEEVVQRYDIRDEPFTEHNIVGELNAAGQALADPSDADRAGAWAEILAFSLTTGHHENPWDSYFGPLWSGVSEDGTKVYWPDIAGTPPTVVDHWSARARSQKHPFLKARYADLAWEMSRIIAKRKRDPEDARVAIDAYIDAIPRMEDDHEHVQFAIRALDLAVLIGDQQRVERARAALMSVHRAIRKRGRGMWWHAANRLLEDKKAGVTDEERAELVADLESIVAFGSDASDPTQFHPHEAKDAAERLISYYRRLNRFDDARRLHKIVGSNLGAD